MFDIGWSELLVVAVVAIIVVGPKDLPRMLRAFGRLMGQVRRTANEFKSQFDEALRDAELDEARRSVEGLGRIDPLRDVRKELSDIKRTVDKPHVDQPETKKSLETVSPAAAKAETETETGEAVASPPSTASKGKPSAAKKPKGKSSAGKSSRSAESRDDAA